MSSPNAVKKYLLSFLAFGAVVGFLKTWPSLESADHLSASVKDASLKPYHETVVRTHKLVPDYRFVLSNRTGNNKPALNEVFTLSAELDLKQNLPELRYEWILPTGVSLSSDSARTGILQNVNLENPPNIEATFVNRTSKNVKIVLRVFSDSGRGGLYAAQYNTQNQLEVDEQNTALAKRQDEYNMQNSETLKKFR